jgi:hypothetical protein
MYLIGKPDECGKSHWYGRPIAIGVVLGIITGYSSKMCLRSVTGLSMSPSRGHSLGHIPHGGRRQHFQTPLPHTSWILHSDEDVTAHVDTHLAALARLLPSQVLEQLRTKLPPDVRVEVSIGVFCDGQAGYLAIEPASLEIVTGYAAHLVVNAYYSEDEEQKPS